MLIRPQTQHRTNYGPKFEARSSRDRDSQRVAHLAAEAGTREAVLLLAGLLPLLPGPEQGKVAQRQLFSGRNVVEGSELEAGGGQARTRRDLPAVERVEPCQVGQAVVVDHRGLWVDPRAPHPPTSLRFNGRQLRM